VDAWELLRNRAMLGYKRLKGTNGEAVTEDSFFDRLFSLSANKQDSGTVLKELTSESVVYLANHAKQDFIQNHGIKSELDFVVPAIHQLKAWLSSVDDLKTYKDRMHLFFIEILHLLGFCSVS